MEHYVVRLDAIPNQLGTRMAILCGLTFGITLAPYPEFSDLAGRLRGDAAQGK